jgi:hypothetical protein
MPDLEHCGYCDAWFDPASLDETFFHGFGSCMQPQAKMPDSGIRGVKADEPAQG